MSEQKKVNGIGIAYFKRAMRCSIQGLSAAYRNEKGFRLELLVCLVLLPLACWLGDTNVERALLAGSLVIFLIVEILNTAVEVVVNRISAERHELSGLAKDLGSAAVALAFAHAAIIWLLVLFT